MAAITIADLTEGKIGGTGVFDELMRATKAHLDEEYSKSRIKGTDYATVYLGAIQAVMDRSLQFLLQEQRTDLEAQLLQEQIETEKLNQARIEQETTNLNTQKLQMEAQTALVEQQTANAIIEGTVLEAQKCKLDAEFDLLVEQKKKTVSETSLLNQKKVTEAAQTSGTNVDADSVIGKQKILYEKQANGYMRDAEQKAAKLLVDTWNVRRTTDEGTQANAANNLSDEYIGAAISRLLTGIDATV